MQGRFERSKDDCHEIILSTARSEAKNQVCSNG
jgi:hypothetical protein